MAAPGWTTSEISTSGQCKDVPARIVDACRAHKGSNEPFRYVEVTASEACAIVLDSAARLACRDEVQRGIAFGALPLEVETPQTRARVGIGNFEERTALAAERTAKASERTAFIVTFQFVVSLTLAAVVLVLSLRD